MSYSILIKNENELEEIPFSTKQNYSEIWLPLIKKLNLHLINEFQFGVELSKQECKQLIDEFERIRNSSILNENLSHRIDFIINEIQGMIEADSYQSLYIG